MKIYSTESLDEFLGRGGKISYYPAYLTSSSQKSTQSPMRHLGSRINILDMLFVNQLEKRLGRKLTEEELATSFVDNQVPIKVPPSRWSDVFELIKPFNFYIKDYLVWIEIPKLEFPWGILTKDTIREHEIQFNLRPNYQ